MTRSDNLPPGLEDFCLETAWKAAAVILPFFRSGLQAENKNAATGADWDPVTAADRAAERVIRTEIEARFPDHGIIGEEFPEKKTDSPYQWVIDPIDGTRAFLCGLPVWGTLIGLLRDGAPVFGAMSQAYNEEIFIGDCETAFLYRRGEKTKLGTRETVDLKTATGLSTCPDLFSDEDREGFDLIRRSVKNIRYGTDCYGYAMLAAGCADFVMESGLNLYDIAPLIPIIRGAGGVVSDWNGDESATSGRILAAGNRMLHQALLVRLKGGADD